MKFVNIKSFAWFGAVAASVLLAGCGGGSSSDNSTASAQGSEFAHKAVLSWTAPATRANGDGIAMGELNSYIINYGQSQDELDHQIVVGDDVAKTEAAPEYVIENLGEGTWYFTIQVRDEAGLLSEPSNVVSKTI